MSSRAALVAIAVLGIGCQRGSNSPFSIGSSNRKIETPDGTPVLQTQTSSQVQLSSAIATSLNGHFTCAVTTDGNHVKCWGNDGHRQLGNASTTSSTYPVTVANFGGTTVLSLGVGTNHACGVLNDNNVYCWGSNANYQVDTSAAGTGDLDARLSSNFPVASGPWSQVSGGDGFTCAMNTSGAVYCAGVNNSGQTGNGNTTSPQSPAVQAGSGLFSAITTGTAHACGIATNGKLYCWGLNTNGQVGIGNTTSPQTTPTQVGTATDWQKISAGNNHTCGIRGTGSSAQVWCWGNNQYAQLGQTNTTNSSSPVAVVLPSCSGSIGCFGSVIPTSYWMPTDISAGQDHTCVIAKDSSLNNYQVMCWGAYNGNGSLNKGQLGNGTAITAVSAITGGSNVPAVPVFYTSQLDHIDSSGHVSAGNYRTCVQFGPKPGTCSGSTVTACGVDSDCPSPQTCTLNGNIPNETRCFGNNYDGSSTAYGVLGNGTIPNAAGAYSTIPVRVQVAATNTPLGANQVSLSKQNFGGCAVTSDNKVRCWGSNGTSSSTTDNGENITGTALLGSLGTNWTGNAGGSSQPGYNGSANPATSSTADYVRQDTTGTPVLGNISSVATGYMTSCAIDTAGAVYCWGSNENSQLGIPADNGTGSCSTGGSTCSTCSKAVAEQIKWRTGAKSYATGTVAIKNVAQIGVGWYHVCALMNSSAKVCTAGTTAAGTTCSVNTDCGTGGTCTSIANQIFCWGGNNLAQSGAGNVTSISSGSDYCATWACNNSPNYGGIPGPYWGSPVSRNATGGSANALTATELGVGSIHSCAVQSGATANVWCWGWDGQGEVGAGVTPTDCSTTAPFFMASYARQVSVAPVLQNAGTYGLQPEGSTYPSYATAHIPVDQNIWVSTCGTAGSADCYCSNTGVANCSDGIDVTTCTGTCTTANNLVAASTGHALGVGATQTCAVANDSNVYCWGLNTFGALGTNGLETSGPRVPLCKSENNGGTVGGGTWYPWVKQGTNTATVTGYQVQGTGTHFTRDTFVGDAISFVAPSGSTPTSSQIYHVAQIQNDTSLLLDQNSFTSISGTVNWYRNASALSNSSNNQIFVASATSTTSGLIIASGGASFAGIVPGDNFSWHATESTVDDWVVNCVYTGTAPYQNVCVGGQTANHLTVKPNAFASTKYPATQSTATAFYIRRNARSLKDAEGGGAYCATGTRALSHFAIPVPGLYGLSGVTVSQVAANETFSCARMSDSSVRCWGLNDNGQLGIGYVNQPSLGYSGNIVTSPAAEQTAYYMFQSTSSPVSVVGSGSNVLAAADIVVGLANACIRSSSTNNPVYCWGAQGATQFYNHHSQVSGIGPQTHILDARVLGNDSIGPFSATTGGRFNPASINTGPVAPMPTPIGGVVIW